MNFLRRHKRFFIVSLSVLLMPVLAYIGFVVWMRTPHDSCSHPEVIQWVASSVNDPDRKVLSIADPRTYMGSLQPGRWARLGSTIEPNDVVLSPDDQYIAVTGNFGVSLYRADTLENLWFEPRQYAARGIAFSPDSSLLAITELLQRDRDNEEKELITTLKFTETGRVLREVPGEIRTHNWIENGDVMVIAYPEFDQVSFVDMQTGEPVVELSNGDLDWSPDGTMYAIAVDKTVEIRNTSDSSLIQVLSIPPGQERHSELYKASSVSWSPDGKYIAAAAIYLYEPIISFNFFSENLIDGKPYVGVQILWDVKTAQSMYTGAKSQDRVYWSPEGTRFMIYDTPNRLGVWDTSTGKNLCSVTHNRFTAFRSMMTEWSDNESLYVWGVSGSGEPSDSFVLHDGTKVDFESEALHKIRVLQWSPNGNMLAAVARKNEVIIWDRETGNQVMAVKPSANISHDDGSLSSRLAWSPDGSRLAVGFLDMLGGGTVSTQWGGTTIIWNVETREEIARLEKVGSSLAWSPDGNLLATESQSGSITVWAMTSIPPSKVKTLGKSEDWLQTLTWSPDGKFIAVGVESAEVYSKPVQVWDIESDKIIQTLQYDAETVAWSPDGKMLAIDDFLGGVILVDTESWQVLWSLQEDFSEILAWSPDGRLLATASRLSNSISVWSVESGKKVHDFEEHGDDIASLSWSPDGAILASGSEDGEIILQDMSKWIDNP